jgi:multidrug resistance efflux pump
MAEEMKQKTATETNGADGQKDGNAENTPSVEELLSQLAAERAEKEKYKNASDKASSEAAKYKKELRSKQTAEEQAAEAQAEAEKLQNEKYENAISELNRMKAVSAYKNVSDKAVEKLIDAVSDADHTAIAAIIESEVKAAVANAQTEWLKSRPPVNAGGEYAGMTKEQIMAISDRAERRKAIAMNPTLFNI